jgi:hypothetical protein
MGRISAIMETGRKAHAAGSRLLDVQGIDEIASTISDSTTRTVTVTFQEPVHLVKMLEFDTLIRIIKQSAQFGSEDGHFAYIIRPSGQTKPCAVCMQLIRAGQIQDVWLMRGAFCVGETIASIDIACVCDE